MKALLPRTVGLCFSPLLAWGCSSGSSEPGTGGPGTSGPAPGFEEASGERGECGLAGGSIDDKLDLGDCEMRSLPGTGGKYCVLAHPDCKNAGEQCPLYIGAKVGPKWHDRVQRPARYGKLISVKAESDGRDFYAELPRVVSEDYPGLDWNRIYAAGFSIGSANLFQALSTGDVDSSEYGTTSDVYAAVANLGGCMKIDEPYPINGLFHLIFINGAEDDFGNEGCDLEDKNKIWARRWAKTNECDNPDAEWKNVEADDPLMAGGDGSDIAEKLTFGSCQHGDVVSYKFKDEGHVLSFKKYFDPKVSAKDMAWDFFQGRAKNGGVQGSGSACNRE